MKNVPCGEVTIGDCTGADRLMLLCITQNSLQQVLDRISYVYYVTGNEIQSTKTKTMCLSAQPKQCSLQVDEVPLKHSEKFKYLGVSFTSDGKQNSELDIIRIEKANAVCASFTDL